MSVEFTASWILPLLLLGFAVGLMVAMFGGGGGFFYVPALTLLFHVPTQFAVATSLASIIPTTISGSVSHYRRGNLNIPVGIAFGTGGIIGALIGAYVSTLISAAFLRKLFGVFMIILTIPMLFSTRRRGRSDANTEEASPSLTWASKAMSAVFGILSGAMAGLFGVSGTPPVIAGLYIMGLPATMVVGTSVFVLLFNAISGLFGHLALGQINLMLTLFLALGAAAGAFLGPRFLGRIKTPTLEKVYGPLFMVMVITLGVVMIL